MIATPPDPSPDRRVRRAFLHGAALLALTGIAATRAAASDQARAATPPIALGPFYPPKKPADSDADLTRVEGRGDHAKGTTLYVTGQVLDTRGRPRSGAELELWQANAFGRYHHPSDTDASGALDPAFQGYGRLVADAEGRFRIKTIKPPPYSGRTPHIHFIVADQRTRLTTQMFFEGEARNERDGLYRFLSGDERRASTGRFVDRDPAMEPEALAVVWNIVLKA
jgi:protocatechuate 3,4-dioxygenase beta subunit